MMAACTIFDEDEVCMPLRRGGFKYGLVVESSEYISSDEDSEDEESRVQKGTVKVAWHPTGNETVVPENKLILADRSLMPGDVVRRLISGTDSQRGFVQHMRVKCHLKLVGMEQYIYNVDINDVKPIRTWDREPDVTLDSWVGHIMEVDEALTLKFPDGARCKVHNASLLSLEDVNDKRDHHSEFRMMNFYVGQELQGNVDDYEDATWMNATRQRGPKKLDNSSLYEVPVLVEKVETKSVRIRWMCKGFTKSGAGVDKVVTPPVSVEGEDLKRMRRLDYFDYCHRQIGDHGYYTIKETDVLVPNLSPRRHVTPDIVNNAVNGNSVVLGTNTDTLIMGVPDSMAAPVSVKSGNAGAASLKENGVHVNGTIDVYDGDVDDDIVDGKGDDSDSLSDMSDASSAHSGHSNPKRSSKKSVTMRIRKKYKGRKSKKKHKKQPAVIKPGDTVVAEIYYTFSHCDVMWQDGNLELNIPSPDLFPIHHLDELEFFPGDFVVESKGDVGSDYGVVTSCDHKERTVMVKWVKPYLGNSGRPEEKSPVELSVYDIKDHPDYKFRPGHSVIRVSGFLDNSEVEAVGQVFKLDPTGVIHVWWPNGVITENYPQDLYIISEEFNSEDGSSEDWTDSEEEEEEEDSNSDVSWDTVEEEEVDGENSEEDTKKKSSKQQPWTVSDSKKKELDELLKRLQGAVSGLLNVFQNVPGPIFKNSKQVFQDILAIFKRCKELEKILKSSFFDDDEIGDLIIEIKEQLRKEKTTNLVRRVTSLYQSRTGDNNVDVVQNRSSDTKCVEKGMDEDSSNAGMEEKSSQTNGDVNSGVGAEGGETRSGHVIEADALRKALIDYGTTLTDPLLQIIFDTSLHLTVAKSANKQIADAGKTSENSGTQNSEDSCQGTGVSKLGDNASSECSETQTKDKNTDDVVKVVEDALDLVCSENDPYKLQVIEIFKKQVEETSQDSGKTTKDSSGLCDTVKGAEGGVAREIHKGGVAREIHHVSKQTDIDFDLPPDHRNLCIRVCKALSTRLLFIGQEITKRWLANKIGIEESLSAMDVFEKLQEKMIESVESGNGPLMFDRDGADEKQELANTEEEFVNLVETEDLEPVISRESTVDKSDESQTAECEIPVHADGQNNGFVLCEETPSNHRFKFHTQIPANPKAFHTAVSRELMLLQSSLPEGITVKYFEDRMDLFSVLIRGPTNTPYEDGLFTFDIQLPANYPSSPPVFHYLSFCSDRLNPNLYEDGKVCVSLLGTWSGKGNEVWTSKSNLLQVLVSIQGLILVNEPYFNEAGYEKQRCTQHGQENSRMYNEMAILKLIQSMTKMAVSPPAMFVSETEAHLQTTALRMIGRVEHWIKLSQRERNSEERSEPTEESVSMEPLVNQGDSEQSATLSKPDFPLLPASKGFCLTVTKYLDIYKNVLSEHILRKPLHNS